MKNGTGKPVLFTRRSIERALRGDTNYVASSKDEEVVIVMDEEQDDISISLHDSHHSSYAVSELADAIGEFMKLCEEVTHDQATKKA